MLREPDAPSPPPGRRKGEPPPYPAHKARGGDIVLRARWERAVFILGLACLFAAIALALWR